jgi:hypothetical protein
VSIGQWPISAPSVMAMTNSYAGQTKRATAVGLVCGIGALHNRVRSGYMALTNFVLAGNLCGIITAQIFRAEWAPRYIPALHGMSKSSPGLSHIISTLTPPPLHSLLQCIGPRTDVDLDLRIQSYQCSPPKDLRQRHYLHTRRVAGHGRQGAYF